MVVTIKLLNNSELYNIMKKILNSVCEKLLVENHGGCCYRNFVK